MGKWQRTKGATYEREICDTFTPVVGYKVKRHIGQARDGGNDITVAPLTLECKRRKTLGIIEGWLQQAKAAVTPKAPIPVVVARSDGGASMVILPLDNFLDLVGDQLRSDQLRSEYLDSDDNFDEVDDTPEDSE